MGTGSDWIFLKHCCNGVVASWTGGRDDVALGMSIGEDLASGSMTKFPGRNLTDFFGLVSREPALFTEVPTSSDVVSCLFSL